MVVSDMKDRLSPNMAPLTTVPAQRRTEIPPFRATTRAIGARTLMVPTLVPMDMEIRQAMTNRPSIAKFAGMMFNSMFAVLTKGADESDDLYEGSMPRPMSREQANRLLTVLKDNGIEDDECLTVAEAICFVTDLDETILQEVE